MCQNHNLKLPNDGKTVINKFCENIKKNIVTLDSDDEEDDDNIVNVGDIGETISHDGDHIHHIGDHASSIEVSDAETEQIPASPDVVSNLSGQSSTIKLRSKTPRLFQSSLSPIQYVLPTLTTIAEAQYHSSDDSIIY